MNEKEKYLFLLNSIKEILEKRTQTHIKKVNEEMGLLLKKVEILYEQVETGDVPIYDMKPENYYNKEAIDKLLDIINSSINTLTTNKADKTYVDTKVSSVYKFMGNVSTYNDLPNTGNEIGHVYNVINGDTEENNGMNYAWNGTGWDSLGPLLNFSSYYKIDEINEILKSYFTIANQTSYASEVESKISSKVDKVEGKSLISDSEIARLLTLANYDDTYVRTKVNDMLLNKVDKVEGKSLISDSEITRLLTLANYDDTEVRTLIANLDSNKVDKVDGKELSTNDYTNEEVTKVSKITIDGDGTQYLANNGEYKKPYESMNQTEYEAIESPDPGTIYFVSDF